MSYKKLPRCLHRFEVPFFLSFIHHSPLTSHNSPLLFSKFAFDVLIEAVSIRWISSQSARSDFAILSFKYSLPQSSRIQIICFRRLFLSYRQFMNKIQRRLTMLGFLDVCTDRGSRPKHLLRQNVFLMFHRQMFVELNNSQGKRE